MPNHLITPLDILSGSEGLFDALGVTFPAPPIDWAGKIYKRFEIEAVSFLPVWRRHEPVASSPSFLAFGYSYDPPPGSLRRSEGASFKDE